MWQSAPKKHVIARSEATWKSPPLSGSPGKNRGIPTQAQCRKDMVFLQTVGTPLLARPFCMGSGSREMGGDGTFPGQASQHGHFSGKRPSRGE